MVSSAQVFADIFDAFAAEYERTRVPRFRPFVKRLLQLYDTRPKARVLDAGCGTGLAATLVAPRVGRDGCVIGVDVSEKQLEIARQKAKNFGFTQCEFRTGEINALDFPDGEFDLVICSFALQGEPAHLFSEFLRVLKPGAGALLCQDWTSMRAPPEAAYEEKFANCRVAQPDERLIRFRAARAENNENWDALATPEDYARILTQVGFRQIQGRVEAVPQHFENARAYVEWRSLETVHSAELDAMGRMKREEFLRAAGQELRSFETANGLDFDWSAIQVVART